MAERMVYYKTAAKYGEVEQTIEKSRFIGYIKPVQNREEAEAFIAEIRALHRSATHNVPAYVIGEKSEMQWASDDKEPSGTAGAPILHLLNGEGITNVAVVVTRYFGGVLLGAGGLLRAYTKAAKEALDDAGIAAVRPWARLSVSCPYALLERVKQMAEHQDGAVEETEYTDCVTLTLLLPEEGVQPFSEALRELSAGQLKPEFLGQVEKSAPR